MGMFDYVNVESMPCPDCGAPLTGWQSKDGGCDLANIDPDTLTCFYTSCKTCRRWVEFSRHIPYVPNPPRPQPFTRAEVEAMGFRLLPKG